MRILVAIAYYGTTNEAHLLEVLDEYRSMSHDVDVVALTERVKELPGWVEQRIGLPDPDPYSLPFAHKELFAERAGAYDLYIYSEDDTLITEAAIAAFVRATDELPAGYVAGFLRTEEHDGTVYCSSAHNHYHWDPRVLLRAGGEVYGHFSNPHSACFLLTRSQLDAALASGEFLRPPTKGRYSMRVTAATDPYTRCGLVKVLPLSRFHDHLLPHLSNRYIGNLGVPLDDVDAQVDRLRSSIDVQPLDRLVDPMVRIDDYRWDLRFHGQPDPNLVATVAADATSALVVGTGSGALEAELSARGIHVVGIPLDPIIAVMAGRRGVATTAAAGLDAALRELADRRFDAIVLPDTLWRFEDPVAVLTSLRRHLGRHGLIVAVVPNLRSERLRVRLGRSTSKMPGRFDPDRHGVHEVDPHVVRRWFAAAGFDDDVRVASSENAGPAWRRALGPVSAASFVCTVRDRSTSAPALVGRAEPKVTIGMPVYNGAQHLGEAIGAARAQTLDDLEIVISDNASDDGTEEICRSAAAVDPRVRYFRQPVNRGAALNYRTTFARSRGRYFTWLAHDDSRLPSFVERCADELDRHESVVLAYPGIRYVDDAGRFIDTRSDHIADESAHPHHRLSTVINRVSRANAVFGLIRAEALAKTRLIDSFIASDLVLLAELSLLGEIREVPELLAVQRIHDGMSTHAHRDRHELAQWFDPTAGAPRLTRLQRLTLEYGRSVARLPMRPSDRLACWASVYSSVAWRTTRGHVGRVRRDLRVRSATTSAPS